MFSCSDAVLGGTAAVGRNDKFAYNVCTHHEEDTHTTADISLKIHVGIQLNNRITNVMENG